MLLLVLLMEARPDEEAKERRNWCKEYHPSLTYEECSKEAGLDIKNGADRCVTFDNLVCEALGIDVESHPPDYIFDALVSGCGI